MYINIYPQFYYYNLYFMYRKKKANERTESTETEILHHLYGT